MYTYNDETDAEDETDDKKRAEVTDPKRGLREILNNIREAAEDAHKQLVSSTQENIQTVQVDCNYDQLL